MANLVLLEGRSAVLAAGAFALYQYNKERVDGYVHFIGERATAIGQRATAIIFRAPQTQETTPQLEEVVVQKGRVQKAQPLSRALACLRDNTDNPHANYVLTKLDTFTDQHAERIMSGTDGSINIGQLKEVAIELGYPHAAEIATTEDVASSLGVADELNHIEEQDHDIAMRFLTTSENQYATELREYELTDEELVGLLVDDKSGLDLTEVQRLLDTKQVQIREHNIAVVRGWLDSGVTEAKALCAEGVITSEEAFSLLNESHDGLDQEKVLAMYNTKFPAANVEDRVNESASDLGVTGPQQIQRASPQEDKVVVNEVHSATSERRQVSKSESPSKSKASPVGKKIAVNANASQAKTPSWEVFKAKITIQDGDKCYMKTARVIGKIFCVVLFPLTLIGRFIVCPLIDRCRKVNVAAKRDQITHEGNRGIAKK